MGSSGGARAGRLTRAEEAETAGKLTRRPGIGGKVTCTPEAVVAGRVTWTFDAVLAAGNETRVPPAEATGFEASTSLSVASAAPDAASAW